MLWEGDGFSLVRFELPSPRSPIGTKQYGGPAAASGVPLFLPHRFIVYSICALQSTPNSNGSDLKKKSCEREQVVYR